MSLSRRTLTRAPALGSGSVVPGDQRMRACGPFGPCGRMLKLLTEWEPSGAPGIRSQTQAYKKPGTRCDIARRNPLERRHVPPASHPSRDRATPAGPTTTAFTPCPGAGS